MQTLVQMQFGSHLYGTATRESDTDIKAVHVPDKRAILLQRAGEVITRNTKTGTDKNTSADTDHESYSIQKFLKLVSDGQTVAIDMLFAPAWAWMGREDLLWHHIRANKERLITSQYTSFVGYCRRQANKYGIKGSRVAEARLAVHFFEGLAKTHGLHTKLYELSVYMDLYVMGKEHAKIVEIAQRGGDPAPMRHIDVCDRKVPYHATVSKALECFKNVLASYGQRSLLAEKNEGVDWKAMSHAVRIAEQAIELLSTGAVTFPRPNASYLVSIKRGELVYADVAQHIEDLLPKIEHEAERSQLRKTPDLEWIDDLVACVHEDARS